MSNPKDGRFIAALLFFWDYGDYSALFACNEQSSVPYREPAD